MRYENYDDLTKEELIQRLKIADTLIDQIQKSAEKEELTNFPWVGNLGQWNWTVPTNKLLFNVKKATNLGYKKEEIPDDVGFEYFTSKLHPNDYDKVMDNMYQHLIGRTEAYEVEYRIRKKNGDYAWYYDRGTIVKRTEEGEALVVSGIVFDISYDKEVKENLYEANKRFKYLARMDDLTSAYNKRYTSQKIIEEMNDLKNNKNLFSLMMLDIDDFKEVNDQYGHQTGDYLLKYLANIIQEKIETTDLVSRWGGDEFLVILKNKSVNEAEKIAKEIAHSLKNIPEKQLASTSLSIGITEFQEETSLDNAIDLVDDLMYEAKFSGKDQIITESL